MTEPTKDVWDERAEELLECMSGKPFEEWKCPQCNFASAVAAALREFGEQIELLKVDVMVRDINNADQAERIKALEQALTDIAEYWNGHENERALTDACEHNVRIARAALEGK